MIDELFQRAGRALAIGITALAVQASSGGEAQAASSCAGEGFLCFHDKETKQYGNVRYDNLDWRDFGWNNRGNWFRNDGRTHNVCLYDGYDYEGAHFLLKRGHTLSTDADFKDGDVLGDRSWKDRVSSNDWTKETQC